MLTYFLSNVDLFYSCYDVDFFPVFFFVGDLVYARF